MKKIQLPAIGGFRKTIYLQNGQAVGTTIAEVGSGTITLTQLAAAINNILQGSGSVTTGSGSAANLVAGPGLSGGGVLVGNVPIRLSAPIPWFEAEQGDDGERGPPGVPGPQGIRGIPGQFLMPEDGADGDWGPPGAAGAVGATGPQGPQGPAGSGTGSGGVGTILMMIPDDHSFDDVLPIPGPVGPPGVQGAQGAQGTTGPAGAGIATHLLIDDASDNDAGYFQNPVGSLQQGNGTFIGQITGVLASAISTGTVYWSMTGAQVQLFIANIVATSNAATLTLTGLPSFLQPPSQTSYQPCVIEDASALYFGEAQIGPSSTITFGKGFVISTSIANSGVEFANGIFTTTGNKGLAGTFLSYLKL